MRGFLISLLASTALIACSEVTQVVDDAQAQIETKIERPVFEASAEGYTRSAEVDQLIQASLKSTYAYDITESLTTEIGPRVGGSPEEAKAREWAVAKFKEIGLENVRIEPFMMPYWERGIETASIVSPYPQQLFITSLGGSVATPPEGIEAEVAYFPTFEDLKNAPEGGLDGKIVFISGRMKKAPDGAGYGPANQKRRQGATEAAKRGAIAVVIRSVGTDSHRFPHTGMMRYADEVKNIPIAALSAPDADQLERTLSRGETLRLKMTMTPQWKGQRESGNVIGDIIGSEKSEEIVLIGGHLDSWDLGTGAVDDGAGIGITAGAAQVLIESGLKPKRTIRVVAFGAEEVGLLGGFAYAKKHKGESLDNHVLATESDFGAEPPYEVLSGVRSGQSIIEDMAKALNLPMSGRATNGGPDIGPMSREGVPTMRFQQEGTDYFDLHHTPDDTFDKIDADDMAKNTAAFATMIWMASEAETDFRGDE